MIDEKKLLEEIKKLQPPAGEDKRGIAMTVFNACKGVFIQIVKNQPKIGEWIPCEKKLPETIEHVIVQVKEIDKPTVGWYGNISGWNLTEKDFANTKDFTVLAWQSLPDTYKG